MSGSFMEAEIDTGFRHRDVAADATVEDLMVPLPTLANELKKRGFSFPPPEQLTDEELPYVLWCLIRCLAELHVFITCTNHLDDRSLYVKLVEEYMLQEIELPSPEEDDALTMDLVGEGTEEATRHYLRYYADEESRNWWAETCPELSMPEAELPAHDRDRRLPRHEDLLRYLMTCGSIA